MPIKRLMRRCSSKTGSDLIRPRQQGLIDSIPPKPVGSVVFASKTIKCKHLPTSSLQPTTLATTKANQGVAHECPTTRNINSISHRPARGNKIPLTSPRTQRDHSHSKPVYLLPSSVRKPKSLGTCNGAAIAVADHESPASGAVGYASSSDVDSSPSIQSLLFIGEGKV